MATLIPVLCSGCSRPIGVSESETPLRNAVFCEEACYIAPVIGDNELRDDLMVELSRSGMSDQAIGDLVGLSRSRVQRIVSKRTPQMFVVPSLDYRKARCPVCSHFLVDDGAEGMICSKRGGCGSEWAYDGIDATPESFGLVPVVTEAS